MKRLFQITAVLLALTASGVFAQDFVAGFQAYKAGDYATALREFTLLSEQGDASAQNNLGMMYMKGDGVPQDYAEAERWFRPAAEQGDAAAQFNLGGLYYRGYGVPQDEMEAVRWIRLAAEQGEAQAQQVLGLFHYTGGGVPQDFETAHMWLNLAASNGDETAAEYREEAASKMTPAGISEAQRRARICLASNYQGCD